MAFCYHVSTFLMYQARLDILTPLFLSEIVDNSQLSRSCPGFCIPSMPDCLSLTQGRYSNRRRERKVEGEGYMKGSRERGAEGRSI